MSNRIDPVQNGITQKPDKRTTESSPAATPSVSGAARSESSDARPAPAGDTVVLTERSQLLERLEKAAASLPEVDIARVEAVKADIASGNYRIDVDNIAEIILKSDAEFGESS